MEKEDAKMNLPLRVKLHLKDGQRLAFEKVKFKATPVGVWITERDKPDITRLFPWGAIYEVEIPFALEEKKIVGGAPGLGGLG